MLKKRKTFISILGIMLCLILAFTNNTEKALAFGGDHIITDVNGSNYSKEMCCQISTSFDSSGNLIVDGYAFFTYVQQYLSKGTGANNTHYYRLKIEGTNFVYNDILLGVNSEDYSYEAMDSTYGSSPLGTSSIYTCTGSQKKNTQLQQTSFRFSIPASDLKQLSANHGQYRLILECTLTNIRFESNKNTKYTRTFNITKLADINFIKGNINQNDYSTSSGKNKITVETTGFNKVRVNANRVVARNSDKSKYSSYNGGYFVKGGLTATEEDRQRNILYDIDANASNVSSSLRGTVMWPLICRHPKSSTTISNISLDELFKQNPSLKIQYENNNKKIKELKDKASIIINSVSHIWNCSKHKSWNSSSTNGTYGTMEPCPYCLSDNGYNTILRQIEEYEQKNMDIMSKCTVANTTTSTVTKTLYCKAIYLEAPQGSDYGTYIKVKELESLYKIITQTKKEKPNSTEMGAAETTKTDSVMGAVTGFNYNYNSKNANVSIPTGYHATTIIETLTGGKIQNPKLPILKTLAFTPSNMPLSKTVNVTVEFRNDKPTIIPLSAKK